MNGLGSKSRSSAPLSQSNGGSFLYRTTAFQTVFVAKKQCSAVVLLSIKKKQQSAMSVLCPFISTLLAGSFTLLSLQAVAAVTTAPHQQPDEDDSDVTTGPPDLAPRTPPCKTTPLDHWRAGSSGTGPGQGGGFRRQQAGKNSGSNTEIFTEGSTGVPNSPEPHQLGTPQTDFEGFSWQLDGPRYESDVRSCFSALLPNVATELKKSAARSCPDAASSAGDLRGSVYSGCTTNLDWEIALPTSCRHLDATSVPTLAEFSAEPVNVTADLMGIRIKHLEFAAPDEIMHELEKVLQRFPAASHGGFGGARAEYQGDSTSTPVPPVVPPTANEARQSFRLRAASVAWSLGAFLYRVTYRESVLDALWRSAEMDAVFRSAGRIALLPQLAKRDDIELFLHVSDARLLLEEMQVLVEKTKRRDYHSWFDWLIKDLAVFWDHLNRENTSASHAQARSSHRPFTFPQQQSPTERLSAAIAARGRDRWQTVNDLLAPIEMSGIEMSEDRRRQQTPCFRDLLWLLLSASRTDRARHLGAAAANRLSLDDSTVGTHMWAKDECSTIELRAFFNRSLIRDALKYYPSPAMREGLCRQFDHWRMRNHGKSGFFDAATGANPNPDVAARVPARLTITDRERDTLPVPHVMAYVRSNRLVLDCHGTVVKLSAEGAHEMYIQHLAQQAWEKMVVDGENPFLGLQWLKTKVDEEEEEGQGLGASRNLGTGSSWVWPTSPDAVFQLPATSPMGPPDARTNPFDDAYAVAVSMKPPPAPLLDFAGALSVCDLLPSAAATGTGASEVPLWELPIGLGSETKVRRRLEEIERAPACRLALAQAAEKKKSDAVEDEDLCTAMEQLLTTPRERGPSIFSPTEAIIPVTPPPPTTSGNLLPVARREETAAVAALRDCYFEHESCGGTIGLRFKDVNEGVIGFEMERAAPGFQPMHDWLNIFCRPEAICGPREYHSTYRARYRGDAVEARQNAVYDGLMKLELAQQLAQALRFLHDEVGATHNDIKPGNVLVRPRGKEGLKNLAHLQDRERRRRIDAAKRGGVPGEAEFAYGRRSVTLEVKLIDFGIATAIPAAGHSLGTVGKITTLWYAPPETLSPECANQDLSANGLTRSVPANDAACYLSSPGGLQLHPLPAARSATSVAPTTAPTGAAPAPQPGQPQTLLATKEGREKIDVWMLGATLMELFLLQGTTLASCVTQGCAICTDNMVTVFDHALKKKRENEQAHWDRLLPTRSEGSEREGRNRRSAPYTYSRAAAAASDGEEGARRERNRRGHHLLRGMSGGSTCAAGGGRARWGASSNPFDDHEFFPAETGVHMSTYLDMYEIAAEPLLTLLNSMLSLDPARRPSMAVIDQKLTGMLDEAFRRHGKLLFGEDYNEDAFAEELHQMFAPRVPSGGFEGGNGGDHERDEEVREGSKNSAATTRVGGQDGQGGIGGAAAVPGIGGRGAVTRGVQRVEQADRRSRTGGAVADEM
eukprot:g7141.t1